MRRTLNMLAILLGIALVGLGLAYGVSRYLVSKLDGTGGVHAPTTEQYSSEDGIAFEYPNTYHLSSRTEGNAERQWDVLLLLPPGYAVPQGGEAPPAISLSIFQNPEGLTLEQWVRGDARSNFKLLSDPGGMGSSTVGNEPALVYKHTGLYETDAVAVAHGGKIFFFEAQWLTPEDQLRTDFANLLSTVHFTQ